MTWIAMVVAVVFTVLGLGCLILVALGLPGTWIFLALALVIEFCDRWYLPTDHGTTFGWPVFLICVLLAGLGELLEFLAGVLGAKRGGSSKRGMVGALIGGILGALLGVALPFPIVGSLIGALVGTFAGAVLGEISSWNRDELHRAVGPALGATVGRLLGTLAKIPIAITVWLSLSISAFWM